MTDRELQDLIGLKKYEQPEEAYFNDFLVEFQQRQRAEILNTSARGLLIERAKAWFTEFGSLRWVMAVGAAYATAALVFYFIPDQDLGEQAVVSRSVEAESSSLNLKQEILPGNSLDVKDTDQEGVVSMVFAEPVDFSTPTTAFFADERIF